MVVAFLSGAAGAQSASPLPEAPQPAPDAPTIRNLPRNFVRDQAGIWTFPVRMTDSDAVWAVVFVAAAAGLGSEDRSIMQNHFLDKSTNDHANTASTGLTGLFLAAPVAFYGMGRAYAKIGQSDRAEDAFKKSVELEPVPLRWNNVAYQMALGSLDLPTARRYAESGIAALAFKMRDTSLEHVGPEDARMTTLMSNLWDTLGWILFEQGHTAEAEKYIKSTWLLHSHGEVGYHLGRVSEAQGRKGDAIQLYEFSLGAIEPSPEARQHLGQLLGSEKDIDQLVEQKRTQLTAMRTISIPNMPNADGVAEFWILLSPGPTVRGVKFISGDEVLRPFDKELETAKYPDTFPEATEIRLLRRGRLVCTGDQKSCRFVFASAETVRTDD